MYINSKQNVFVQRYNLPFFAEQATKIMSHRNENPVVNFTRTYEDYEHGFGDVRTNNFWLGLYK